MWWTSSSRKRVVFSKPRCFTLPPPLDWSFVDLVVYGCFSSLDCPLSLIPWKRVKLQELTCEERGPLLAYCNMMLIAIWCIRANFTRFIHVLKAPRGTLINHWRAPWSFSLLSNLPEMYMQDMKHSLPPLISWPPSHSFGPLPYVFQSRLCVISVIFTWCRGPLVWLMPSVV